LEWSIEAKPSYSVLKVRIKPGESVSAEPGAMVYMSDGIAVETRAQGGVLRGLLRSVFAGESFFINTFRAVREGEVWFAPPLPGDIHYIELKGNSVYVQDTSYLAHHGNIDLSIAWRGLKGLLAEGELLWLKLSGIGGVWVTSYGGIEELRLEPGERVIVDNFHLVAMDDSVKWNIRKFGGLKSFLFGGEGLVVEVIGPGRILVQTRSLPAFIGLISKYIGRRK